MNREKEPKNAFARKIQKLTTRSRSSSSTPSFSAPPSPTDYFSQDKQQQQQASSPGYGSSAPLTPVTPTGLSGTVGAHSEAIGISAPEDLTACCPYCKNPTEAAAINPCSCNTLENSESLVESEAIADKMAQKILHQVVSQSEQGWTI